jgi:uncharacterized membrane protein
MMTTPEWVWLGVPIHVVEAVIWVSGTSSIGIVVWNLRRTFPSDPETVYRAASSIGRAFGRVMWPALAVAIVSGLPNLSWYVPAGENWTEVPDAAWLWLGGEPGRFRDCHR